MNTVQLKDAEQALARLIESAWSSTKHGEMIAAQIVQLVKGLIAQAQAQADDDAYDDDQADDDEPEPNADRFIV